MEPDNIWTIVFRILFTGFDIAKLGTSFFQSLFKILERFSESIELCWIKSRNAESRLDHGTGV